MNNNYNYFSFIIVFNSFYGNWFNIFGHKWGLGIGDWGLGIGDWAQSPIPNPHLKNLLLFMLGQFY
jgi:hypothetical protein